MQRPEERRRFQRVANHFNVRISRKGARRDGNSPAGGALSIYISAGGVLVSVEDVLNVRGVVRIPFLKPNSLELFQCDAERKPLCWCYTDIIWTYQRHGQ